MNNSTPISARGCLDDGSSGLFDNTFSHLMGHDERHRRGRIKCGDRVDQMLNVTVSGHMTAPAIWEVSNEMNIPFYP